MCLLNEQLTMDELRTIAAAVALRAHLFRFSPVPCTCWHQRLHHDEGGCQECDCDATDEGEQ